MRDWLTRILSGMLGAGLVAYFWIYLPMAHNYEQCGKVTLCQP